MRHAHLHAHPHAADAAFPPLFPPLTPPRPPPPPAQAQCTGPSQLRRALSLVADMRARGVPLNTHTYSAILNVCIKAGQAELALDVYSQMLSEGLVPNLVTYNTLLEVYAKQARGGGLGRSWWPDMPGCRVSGWLQRRSAPRCIRLPT